mmetsp:Transcript_10456/g.32756  ORF Transcript_10456/g.32756 Transcript_10456/m.32756 type:complete len:134 (-) Transcript_10456:322-723(-)
MDQLGGQRYLSLASVRATEAWDGIRPEFVPAAQEVRFGHKLMMTASFLAEATGALKPTLLVEAPAALPLWISPNVPPTERVLVGVPATVYRRRSLSPLHSSSSSCTSSVVLTIEGGRGQILAPLLSWHSAPLK